MIPPPFTVQILAENAVRHGIRGNKGGCGTLTIRTYRAKGAHVIEVQDDGKGFDAAILAKLQSGAEMQGHIGLKNLRERLALMSGVPVIPVVTNGSYFKKARARVLIGKPLYAADLAPEGLEEYRGAGGGG